MNTLFTILISLSSMTAYASSTPVNPDCGIVRGGIEQRIADCARFSESVKIARGVTWNLVARRWDSTNARYYETWKDSKGLIWADLLDNPIAHYDSVVLDQATCTVDVAQNAKNCAVIKESACDSNDGHIASLQITEKSFGLPTIEEFLQAVNDGAQEVLPFMCGMSMGCFGGFYWSSSLDINEADSAHIFVVTDGTGGSVRNRKAHFAIRCVAR